MSKVDYGEGRKKRSGKRKSVSFGLHLIKEELDKVSSGVKEIVKKGGLVKYI